MSARESLSDRCERAVPNAVARFFVPGRIEVFGKHTDYAGGRSLLAAVDRGFTVVAKARHDGRVIVTNALTGDACDVTNGAGAATPLWTRYPDAVLRRARRNFNASVRGADIAFASDLPIAAGLSSSSALVVACWLALDAINGFSNTDEYCRAIPDREQLAGYLGAVENGLDFGPLTGEAGVGTQGGSEDHTAILCAQEGRVVQYSFMPVRFEASAASPVEYIFAIGSTGVQAEKAGAALAAYNRLSQQTQTLVSLWRDATGGTQRTLGAIVATKGAIEELRSVISREPDHAALGARLSQFAAETNELIPGAVHALVSGDIDAFGELSLRSQELGVRGLENQIPETLELAALARDREARAASPFGAGFGGSVWALVRRTDAATFLERWRADYLERFPQHAGACAFFASDAAPPARRLD